VSSNQEPVDVKMQNESSKHTKEEHQIAEKEEKRKFIGIAN
jgi:hypothetical protein